MNSRTATLLATVAGLAATGWTLSWVVAPRAGAAGPDAGLAILGGLRPLAADLLWLKMAAAWEACDVAATGRWLRLVTAVDPAPLYFWVNGARIMAYDMTEWRITAAGGRAVVPTSVQKRIAREQATSALKHLDEAMRLHPASAALWIERANLECNGLGDLRAAAESYRHAWAQPEAPYFSARLHAELLRRLGERSAALAWLVKLHPQLPRDDESAQADLVLARIRVLERELSVPADETYRPR